MGQSAADDCAAAESLVAEAERLRAAGNEESLRAAIERYALALPLWHAAGDVGSEGDTFFHLGLCRSQLGDKGGALDAYLQALPLQRAAGDRTGESRTLNNIGVAYDYLGEDQKALVFYRQALALNRELGDRDGQAAPLTNIGLIYSALGEHREALAYHRQALALRGAGDRSGRAIVLLNIGLAHSSMGEKKKALRYFRQSLALRREVRDRRGEGVALSSIGSVYAALGDTAKALRYLEQALAIKREAGDRASEAYTLQSLGSIYSSAGQTEKALQSYRAALEIRRTLRIRGGEALTRASIARLESKRGNLQAAREQIEAALAIVEALRGKLALPDVRASYFAGKESYYDFYVDLLIRLHERDRSQRYDIAAFEASERARARSLLDVVTAAGVAIREGTDPNLLQRQDDLRRRIITAERQRSADDELRRLRTEAEEVEAQIRVRSPHYAALTQPVPLSLAEIRQRVLDEDTVLLEYALGKERSFVWMVTRTSFATFVLPSQHAIEAEALRCHGLLMKSNQRMSEHQADLAAAKLGSMLLGPLSGRLGRKRLLIVADGALQRLPFAALRAPRQLVLDHEVIMLPSASVLGVLRQEIAARPTAPHPIAILADPQLRDSDAAGLPRLPFARREAETIASLAPAGGTLTALGADASRELVMSGRLAEFRVIHFATHAVVDNEHPERSAIALSSGMLRMSDIYNLRLGADLVVLSACETAIGKELRGEGLIGLVRGFMYAGAPRVVASLWKVNDAPTASLMSYFYQATFRRGMPAAAALRSAQLAMLRHPRWRAPVYWAGFILQGEWTGETPRTAQLHER